MSNIEDIILKELQKSNTKKSEVVEVQPIKPHVGDMDQKLYMQENVDIFIKNDIKYQLKRTLDLCENNIESFKFVCNKLSQKFAEMTYDMLIQHADKKLVQCAKQCNIDQEYIQVMVDNCVIKIVDLMEKSQQIKNDIDSLKTK